MKIRTLLVSGILLGLTSCAALPLQDPLTINVAGIEALPGEGLELRLAVTLRIQNPNDGAIDFTGAALDLALNGRRLASGVSGSSGQVPRFGELVVTIPVTISAFNVARQLIGFMNNPNPESVTFSVDGKLQAGMFSARRFSDEVEFDFSSIAQ
jgi:LEA14-like dessication related protein